MAATQRDVKTRIESVKNIRKITRAMEMVAAARLRRAEQRIAHLRPYAGAIRRMTRQAAEDQVAVVFAATNGFLDRINADRVGEFHEGLVERLHADTKDTLGKIAEGEWSDEIQDSLRDAIEQFADDFGYDLDEEGQPMSEETDIQPDEGRRRERDESAEEGEEERETVGAEA